MKVYRVDAFAKPPGTKFRYYAHLDCKDSDERFLDAKNFDGRPFPKKWRRVELHFSEPLWPRADFYTFQSGVFVCTERAKALVGPSLAKVGEFLPVFIEGEAETHYLYNVTDCSPYIDPVRSIWECSTSFPEELEDPTKGMLATPAFDLRKMEKRTVFKIPQEPAIYCTEQFETLVKDQKLTGLRFQLAWSDKSGPTPLERPPAKGGELVWKTGDGKDYRSK